jgi:hypothetical protein
MGLLGMLHKERDELNSKVKTQTAATHAAAALSLVTLF